MLFLKSTKPLSTHKTFEDNAKVVYHQFILIKGISRARLEKTEGFIKSNILFPQWSIQCLWEANK